MVLSTLAGAVHFASAVLSGYLLYPHCTICVQNMRLYQNASERAAKYSNVAENELQQTRTTLGAACVGSFINEITNIYPFFRPEGGAAWLPVFLAGINLVTLVGAQGAISRYWRAKSSIPGAAPYNDTLKRTATISTNMRYLIILAGVSLVLSLF